MLIKFEVIKYFVFLYICSSTCALVTTRKDNVECEEIPKDILEEVLGASFNPRYMSIEPPEGTEIGSNGKKRAPALEDDFYVDDSHYEELGNEPAWTVKNHVKSLEMKTHSRRFKRHLKLRQEWECDSVIVWKDLGPDYFPRFLRTVECTQSSCWYKLYKCEPRSFTVKILRRKRNLCVLAERGFSVLEACRLFNYTRNISPSDLQSPRESHSTDLPKPDHTQVKEVTGASILLKKCDIM